MPGPTQQERNAAQPKPGATQGEGTALPGVSNYSRLRLQAPEMCDGAASIETKIPIRNPAVHVYHIRQAHAASKEAFVRAARRGRELTPALEKELDAQYQEIQEWLGQVSKDMNRIALDLAQKHGVREFYLEGLTIETFDRAAHGNSAKGGDQKIIREAAHSGQGFKKSDEPLETIEIDARVLAPVEELLEKGLVERICPFEREATYQRAVDLAYGKHSFKTQEEVDQAFRKAQEERKKVGLELIERIERKDDGVAVVFLGAEDDLSEVIAEKNREVQEKRNAQRRIAYTVITPEHLEPLPRGLRQDKVQTE